MKAFHLQERLSAISSAMAIVLLELKDPNETIMFNYLKEGEKAVFIARDLACYLRYFLMTNYEFCDLDVCVHLKSMDGHSSFPFTWRHDVHGTEIDMGHVGTFGNDFVVWGDYIKYPGDKIYRPYILLATFDSFRMEDLRAKGLVTEILEMLKLRAQGAASVADRLSREEALRDKLERLRQELEMPLT